MEQRRVIAGQRPKAVLVANRERDSLDFDLVSWCFDIEVQVEAFVGLQRHQQQVAVAGALIVEQAHRRPAVPDEDDGGACRHPLTGAQIEGDALPAPVVDGDPHCDVGRCGRIGRDPLQIAISGDVTRRGVLAEDDLSRVDRSHRGQHLHLLGADRVRFHIDRRLHRHHREQLGEMVLHHVSHGACLFVVRLTALHAVRFGHGDLDRLDVVPVPGPLEQGVGEAEDEEVPHRLLGQKVIDAIDVALVEPLVNDIVETPR